MRKSLSALAPMSRRGIRGGDCRFDPGYFGCCRCDRVRDWSM